MLLDWMNCVFRLVLVLLPGTVETCLHQAVQKPAHSWNLVPRFGPL